MEAASRTAGRLHSLSVEDTVLQLQVLLQRHFPPHPGEEGTSADNTLPGHGLPDIAGRLVENQVVVHQVLQQPAAVHHRPFVPPELPCPRPRGHASETNRYSSRTTPTILQSSIAVLN